MSGQPVDTRTALANLGQTVVMELHWEEVPHPLFCCYHIVGVVVPVEGVCEEGYFLVKDALAPGPFPDELFWSDIRRMKVLVQRPCQRQERAGMPESTKRPGALLGMGPGCRRLTQGSATLACGIRC